VFFDEEEDELLVGRITRALAGQGDVRYFRYRLPSPVKNYSTGTAASLSRSRTAVTAKHGQAVVKILSFGHGRQSVRNQASYISRKAELALEDQDGNQIEGSEELKDLVDDWSVDFSEFLNARDSMHMQISVPIGSDRAAAHDAVRAFAAEVFSENHEYVFVRHDDTEHPHSHIIVKTKGYDGIKLNPRKKELAAWRDVYARLRPKGAFF